MTDLTFDGVSLTWRYNGKTYRATTGYKGYQNPKDQKIRDAAIPEGTYWARLIDGGAARVIGPDNLDKRDALTSFPAEDDSGRLYNAPEWGTDRIRLNADDPKKTFGRGGFYLHDSRKGYSHGCIEVQESFFDDLRAFMATPAYTKLSWAKKKLTLTVKYRSADMETNGRTGIDAGAWTPEQEKRLRDTRVKDGVE
jgi:hypothetical protein